MTVEVLIVSYNTVSLLRDCLRSIDAHRPPGIELSVAVWDNASADGSAEMVRAEFPAVRLVHSSENVGFGRANNRLAAASTADLLLLCNSDTLWVDDLVTPLLECLDAHPAAIAAGPRLELPSGERQASVADFPRLWHELVLLGEAVVGPTVTPIADRLLGRADSPTARETEVLWATCWLMRRRDIERHGLFDESFVIYDEDFDFCQRMRALGRTFVYEPRARLIHRSGGSADALTRSVLMRRGRERLYRRHRGRGTALAYRLMMEGLSRLRHAGTGRAGPSAIRS